MKPKLEQKIERLENLIKASVFWIGGFNAWVVSCAVNDLSTKVECFICSIICIILGGVIWRKKV
jgi:hypothetical protein